MALPSGYKQVEYIESTGTQYIDTGYTPNQGTRVIADLQVTSAYNSFMFGGRTGTSTATFAFLWHAASSAFRSDYRTSQLTFSTSLNATDRYTVDKNKNVCTVGGLSVTHSTGTFTTAVSMYVFACNTNGTTSLPSAMRLWSFKIYDNDVLVRDYIPCINPSGEIGLYDLVNATFYGNAGSGSFTAGEVIQTFKGSVFVDGAAKEVVAGYCMIDGVWKPLVRTHVIQTNYHAIKFESLDGLVVTGVWNESQARLEC